MLGQFGRQVVKRVMTPAAAALLRMRVTPDAVTIAGTIGVVGLSLWLFPTGNLAVGALVIGLLTLFDSLDGTMARLAGRSSVWGAFLDSTLDRIADAAIFAGLTVYLMVVADDRLGAAMALTCLVLGAVVSYARARAEGLGMTASVGIAERADRLLVALVATFAVGLGAPVIVLTIALTVLAAASLVTIIQRVLTVRKQALGLGGDA